MFEVMLSGNISTVLGDTLVVLISMTLLLFLVKYFAWDKVNAMLEARREKITHLSFSFQYISVTPIILPKNQLNI